MFRKDEFDDEASSSSSVEEFDSTYITTIFENYAAPITLRDDGTFLELAVWDTAGQVRKKPMTNRSENDGGSPFAGGL